MQIIPAVDLLDGAAVRLLRGDYGAVTGYGRDPAAIARGFVSQGAGLVHVVDLEAARGGQRQVDTVEAVLDAGVPIQLGGGIRTARDARWAVDAGASRVVVGSALVGPSDGPGADIVEAVGAEAVVAAVDVRDGRALGSGWLDGGSALGSVLDRIVRLGIPRMLVTGIERDGTMAGPDLDLLSEVRASAPGVALIASGGVGTLDDIGSLVGLGEPVEAAIVGRALYERRFTLGEAIDAAG